VVGWRRGHWKTDLDVYLDRRTDYVGRIARGLLRPSYLETALSRARRARGQLPADLVSGWDEVVAFLELIRVRRGRSGYGRGS
jgi:hypothetical protein